VRYQDKIYEGMSVELIVPDGEYKGRYRTRVEEVGTRILSVGTPFSEGRFIPLREGTVLEVVFADEISAYSFFSTIIRRVGYPIPTFIMEFPEKIRKIQRRQFVRVPVALPITYRIVDREGLSEVKDGIILDLSGGGIQLKTYEDLPSETILLMKMDLGTNTVEVPGMTIRSVKEQDKQSYLVSIRFHEISERLRDSIIRYVFEVQREMRKKGLV